MTQTILITGASSGYGRATAQAFLDRGWNVIAASRRADASQFAVSSGRLRALRLDVTDPASISAAFDDGIAAFGKIDVVVNNAGIGLLSAFEVTPEDTMREIFETNTFGVMAVCRAAIPRLRAQGGGAIINVTSSAGIAPMPMVAIYTASKSAIEGFSESLAYEMAHVGIRVRIVEPGLGPTTGFATEGAQRMRGLTPAPYDAYAAGYMERMRDYPTAFTKESDVADAVWRAVSEDGDRLRYPAGPDAELMAALRWGDLDHTYRTKMRTLFAPR